MPDSELEANKNTAICRIEHAPLRGLNKDVRVGGVDHPDHVTREKGPREPQSTALTVQLPVLCPGSTSSSHARGKGVCYEIFFIASTVVGYLRLATYQASPETVAESLVVDIVKASKIGEPSRLSLFDAHQLYEAMV